MLIRPATLIDLNACLALNADSQTDHVWQMEQRSETHGGIFIRFQPVRLPRVMYVTYPRQRDDLVSCWKDDSMVLVASDKQVSEQADALEVNGIDEHDLAKVFGYCQLDAQLWQRTGWISHLVVDRPFRRQGIGTALLKASIAWGRDLKLKKLMIAVQTKNHPAISFCEKFNFTFCGFNDHYFVNRDIALFFTLRL
ncbi:MAG: GNAT family N-acetyltransferase [Anaerolineae bacterium]|nr:GNAT family N-acetyltransferase [Anaerolineae bacterium]